MKFIKLIKKSIFKLYFKIKLFVFNFLLRRNKLSVLYDKRFFRQNIRYSVHTARIFSDYVVREFNPALVYDFGCGNGIYLKYFLEKNVDVFGIDGSEEAGKNFLIEKRFFSNFDLRKPVELLKKSDIAICIEVAEHLEPAYADILIENISNNCRGTVFFTAAPPGQGGTNHVNEQSKQYWIEKFAKQSFVYDDKKTKELKFFLANNKAVHWVVNNIMIFEKSA